jgi:hypothetical protein
MSAKAEVAANLMKTAASAKKNQMTTLLEGAEKVQEAAESKATSVSDKVDISVEAKKRAAESGG